MKVLAIISDPLLGSTLKEFASALNHELIIHAGLDSANPSERVEECDVTLIETDDPSLEWPVTIETHVREFGQRLILVGNASDDQVSVALSHVPDAYLIKPVHPSLLSLAFRQIERRMGLECRIEEAGKEAMRVLKELENVMQSQREAIAEKELTYRELLLAYSRLQELNQQKNNFLAMATHELRTPVTVMRGYHRLLLDERLGKLQPQQKEVLLESDQSCTRLIKIINALLDLSRIEAGKLDLIYQENSIANDVKLVINQMRDLCKRKQLSLVLKLDKDLPRFKYDRDRISQVLTNLLENSIKYTPSGGKIYVSAQPYFWDRREPATSLVGSKRKERRVEGLDEPDPSKNSVMVEVNDTGIGISAEHQQEIFDEFTQVSSNQMNRTGLGLGLHISKRIINAHGGKIWVDSQPNTGSKFMFLLPIVPADNSSGASGE